MCLRGTILLLLSFGISSKCVLVEKTENLTDFLDRRITETKVEIAKAYVRANTESVTTVSYDIKWEKLWSESLKSEGARTVCMFNKMFILEGNRVMSVIVEPASNKTSSSLREVALIRHERSVRFVKSIVWKSNLYLLVCHDAIAACSLYTGKNDFHLKHRQIIKHKGRPMDATFFTMANRLYLAVAYSSDPVPVSSVIYHWTGTYMDIIEEIPTVGAVAVTAFNYKSWIVIVFGQNEKDQPDVGSKVYELNDYGIRMIQYLSTNGPISIHYYYHKGDIFLLTINGHGASNVYWWDGKEFLHWHDLVDIVAPRIVNIVQLRDETLFFVAYEKHVCLYKVTSAEYSRLKLLEFKSGETLVDMGVWIDEKTTLTLLLVTADTIDDSYRIEPWELRIKKISKNEGISSTSVGASEECLKKLHARLNERTVTIENIARNTWPMLLSSVKNITVDAIGSKLSKLVVGSTGIARLDVSTRNGILLANEMETLADPASRSDTPGLRIVIDLILEKSRNSVRTDEDNSLVGDVVIKNNGIFEELRADAIRTEFFNDVPAELEKSVISATKSQKFSQSQQLRGKNITVRQLEIDQLCGISRKYWLQDEKSNEIFVKNNAIEIINDSVLVRTDLLSFRQLKSKTIQHVRLNDFFSNIFVIGERQIVKGNLMKRSGETLNINDLIVEKSIRDASMRDVLTRGREQVLENFVFAKTMSIENLIVDKMNGIDVADSAMVKKKNRITGQVSVAVLRISDELVMNRVTKFPKVRPVQVYDRVTVVGEIKASNLALEESTYFSSSARNASINAGERHDGIESAVRSYWTKSTNQIVKNPVTLDAGLSVDELTLKYLNGLNVNEDIVSTRTKEISPVAGSLEFKNLIASGSILEEAVDVGEALESVGSNELYSVSDDALYFNREFRIERLGVRDLSIKNYNGIPLDEIIQRNLRETKPYEYPYDSIQRFDSVTISDRLQADNLDFRFVNGANELSLQTLLASDANYKMKFIGSDKLILGGNVTFGDATAKNIKELITLSNWSNDKSALMIDGELLVEGDSRVVAINNRSTESYLDYLSTQDLEVNSYERTIIDKLTVRHDFKFNLIRDLQIESLTNRTFSKSRVQRIDDSRFTFFKVSVDNLQAESINERLTSSLVYTDSYDVNFDGNVVFSSLKLSLDDDIQTRYLNGYRLNELYEKLSSISPSIIDDLTVRGNVFWESREESSVTIHRIGSLEGIIKNSLRVRTADNALQVIKGPTRIDESGEGSSRVFARRMEYRSNSLKSDNSNGELFGDEFRYELNGIDLRKIVDRSVLDDSYTGNEVQIVSETVFGEDLTTGRLSVDGEIGIDNLDSWSVNDLKSSVVEIESSSDSSWRPSRRNNDRRDDRQGQTMIFSTDVNVQRLIIRTGNAAEYEATSDPLLDGVPIKAIVVGPSDSPNKLSPLPNNTHLQHLRVDNEVSVESLDSVNFNEFVNDRVTLGTASEVHGNIRFNGLIRVTDAASVRKINGVVPSDLVINYSHQDTIITGHKTFHGDIATYGKTYAPRIASVNFRDEYDNALLNYESVDIIGDITFQTNVETSLNDGSSDPLRWQLSTDSFVNEMRLKSLTKDHRRTEEEKFLRSVVKNESLLEERVSRAANSTNRLPEIFYYFETDENLRINVANVARVEYLRVEDLTILNMYANEFGRYCGLADDCPCRGQYVAEISSNDCHIRRVDAPRRTAYNFHPANGAFGISVTTTSVSTSKRCTTGNSSSEFTTISWMKNFYGAAAGKNLGSNVTREKLDIRGYLSDVRVFMQSNVIFIVLAIYYDPIEQSHRTNSLIYALDLATDDITLVQSIPTNRAIELEIFKISSKGVHILFSSLGPSGFGKPAAESLLYRFHPRRLKFELLRSFSSGGNRHSKSLTQSNDEFLLLDDIATNSINVYIYDGKTENFYHHQSLYLDSTAPITAIECFYAGEIRHSQAYVIIVTEHDRFFVYEYMFIGGFQLITHKRVNGILSMIPFDVSNRRYMFLGTDTNSTVLRIVEQGRR